VLALCIASSCLARGGGYKTLHIDVHRTFDEYHEIPCLTILICCIAHVPDIHPLPYQPPIPRSVLTPLQRKIDLST
jgi:hypothetical protein